jgi:hypothetical protein
VSKYLVAQIRETLRVVRLQSLARIRALAMALILAVVEAVHPVKRAAYTNQ